MSHEEDGEKREGKEKIVAKVDAKELGKSAKSLRRTEKSWG